MVFIIHLPVEVYVKINHGSGLAIDGTVLEFRPARSRKRYARSIILRHDIRFPRALRLESLEFRRFLSRQSFQHHVKRRIVSGATIDALRVYDTAHLIYGHGIDKRLRNIFQFGRNPYYRLSLVCHERIVSRVSGRRYHLLGARVHGNKYVVCIRFRGMLLHTICINV